MFKDKKALLIVASVILFVIWFWYDSYKSGIADNQHNCETTKMALDGVVTGTGSRDPTFVIFVNNVQNAVWINSTKELYSKGFKTAYGVEVGDSVTKKAGSKDVTFRRGDSSIVLVLDCDN